VKLAVEDIGKSFAGNRVLESISFELKPQSRALLLGPSGSGKSTLLNIICGLQTPDSGRVALGEHSIASAGTATNADAVRKSHMGIIFQTLKLVSALTVRANLSLAQKLQTGANNPELIDDTLEKLGIAHRAAARPFELSQGEAQRAAIARALVVQPDILIADEPTSALDSANTETVAQLLIDVTEKAGGENRDMMSLAIAYLRDRPLTTALNVLLLTIAVAMLVLLLQFGNQANERFERDAQNVDLVVGAKGSPLQLILSSIFHIDQPTGNVPLSSLELLRTDPAVERAVPLALGDNFNGYRIVGSDETFSELYGLELAEGATFDKPLQAVMGATVAEETGATLGQKFMGTHGLGSDEEEGGQAHDHATFETVGILAPSGTVADRLILTSVESVWDVHGIDHDHDDHKGHDHERHGEDSHEGHDHADESTASEAPEQTSDSALQAQGSGLQPELTALLVTYSNASAAIRIPAMINRQTEMQSAVPATETARLLELLGASLDGIRIFAWLLAVTGGLAIFVALLNMARSREADLALLRVMGASRVQVFATVIMEGVITAAIGAVLGWLCAHGLISVARSSFATLSDLGLTPWSFIAAEGGLLLAVVAIGAIAALIPALRVYHLDPAHTMARM